MNQQLTILDALDDADVLKASCPHQPGQRVQANWRGLFSEYRGVVVSLRCRWVRANPRLTVAQLRAKGQIAHLVVNCFVRWDNGSEWELSARSLKREVL